MVARLEQRHAHQQDGRHAAGSTNRSFGAFERGQTLLKAGHGGIGGARIGVSLLGACKAQCGCSGIGLDKAAGQVQCLGVLAIGAARNGLAHRERVGMQAGR